MSLRRRTVLQAGMTALAAAAVPAGRAQEREAGDKVGICDWSLGESCNPDEIAKAARAGLNGIQVSVGTRPDFMPLRETAVRRRYLDEGARRGVRFPSVAAGSILNRIPLKSEPQSAIYVVDAVEAAAALGSRCILIAFFGAGDLRLRDASGELRNVSQGEFASYKLDARGVARVVEALRQIAPRAEDAKIILGLENTLTAEQNLDILDRVGSSIVQVYYDVGNSTAYGYDVPGEIRRLGKERICEIHVKETLGLDDPASGLLGGPAKGGVEFEGVAAAVRDIDYDEWFVLELSGRQGRFIEDTQANADFVRSRLRG